jgi:putative membrane protein
VLGQILFILSALLCLIGYQGGGRFIWPVLGGMVLLSLGIAGFIYTQHRGGTAVRHLASFFGKHIAEGWRDSLVDNVDAFQRELDGLWGKPGRIAASAATHFVGWLSSAALTFMAFRLLGAHVTYPQAVAIEGVVCGIMSAGFLVPASLGVQEAAYVALGMLFGVDPKIALGLSLLRRGRDIALGIPVLLIWQTLEMRALRGDAAPARHLGERRPLETGPRQKASS